MAAARVARCSAPRSCCSAASAPTRWGHLLGVRHAGAGVRPRRRRSSSQMLGYPAAQRVRELDASVHLDRRSAGSRSTLGLRLDQLSICFVLLITGVGSLIHIYSVGYMSHDPERRRFFGYMNLFLAAMLLLVLADNYLVAVRRLGGRRSGVVPADRLLAVQADRRDRGQEGVHRQPGRRRRPVARDHADVRQFGTVTFTGVFGARRRRRSHGVVHRDRAAAAARRLRQVRPGPAAVLAARRDGGPDPGVGADPRGDDGHRRRLPDRAVRADLQPVRGRPARGRDRRRRHAAVRRDHRLREGRHQEGARRLDDEPDRLHDAGRRPRPGRLRVRHRRTCSRTASSRPACSSAPARSCTR